MFYRYLSVFLLFALTPIITYAQTAKLYGPAKKDVGKLVIIKAVGYDGVDYKFECAPKNQDWEVVKFQDNSLGVIFSTDKPGHYHFFLAVSDKSGKIATAVHTVKIESNTDTTVVDANTNKNSESNTAPAPEEQFIKALKEAYKKDLAAGSVIGQKNLLSSVYKTAPVNDKNLKTVGELFEVMRKVSKGFLADNVLVNLRTELANQERQIFSSVTPTAPLTNELRAEFGQIFSKISSVLDSM